MTIDDEIAAEIARKREMYGRAPSEDALPEGRAAIAWYREQRNRFRENAGAVCPAVYVNTTIRTQQDADAYREFVRTGKMFDPLVDISVKRSPIHVFEVVASEPGNGEIAPEPTRLIGVDLARDRDYSLAFERRPDGSFVRVPPPMTDGETVVLRHLNSVRGTILKRDLEQFFRVIRALPSGDTEDDGA